MATDFLCVMTTIQAPTGCVRSLAKHLDRTGGRMLVMGDKKGPSAFDLPPHEFFSLEAQLALPFSMARQLPVGHYVRKNLGYLIAISRGTPCIYETDDDNAPADGWTIPKQEVQARAVPMKGGRLADGSEMPGWFNVYRMFSDQLIWPRGLPLDAIHNLPAAAYHGELKTVHVRCPIQQGLADLAPDVDAVWRLVLDRPFNFEKRPSAWLPAGVWCPFNSQNTWWWPEAYPLLYLPSFCTFRMTDIWRSFVAQRCLWEMGLGLVFHAADVVQERNAHNLMRDFKDEIPGYEHNAAIAASLAALKLGSSSVSDNLLACYEQLVASGFFPAKELDLVMSWINDLNAMK